MKITALTARPEIAYSWWRITQPFHYLRANGIDARVCKLSDNVNVFIEEIQNSIVILQRTITGKPHELTHKLYGMGAKAILYEVDDDIFSPDFIQHMNDCGRSGPAAKAELIDSVQKHIDLMALCDGVTTTTPELAAVIRRYTDKPVYVIPNAIDVDWYVSRLQGKSANQYQKTQVTIGWSGGLRPDYDLRELAAAWNFIAEEYSQVKFVIGGWQPEILYEHVPFDRIIKMPYAPIDEWPKNMQMDIGCAPLEDTPFNRCKSPIKYFEYIMAGTLPLTSTTVYQPEVRYDLLVTNDRNDWIEALSLYIEDDQLRYQLMYECRAEVKLNHDLKHNWIEWAKVYANFA